MEENNKIGLTSIIIAAIILVGGLFVGWYFYSKANEKTRENPPVGEIKLSPKLSQQQISDLIKSMSAGPTATPVLSKTQLEKLSKSMSASKTAEPVLSLEQQKKLIESMSAK